MRFNCEGGRNPDHKCQCPGQLASCLRTYSRPPYQGRRHGMSHEGRTRTRCHKHKRGKPWNRQYLINAHKYSYKMLQRHTAALTEGMVCSCADQGQLSQGRKQGIQGSLSASGDVRFKYCVLWLLGRCITSDVIMRAVIAVLVLRVACSYRETRRSSRVSQDLDRDVGNLITYFPATVCFGTICSSLPKCAILGYSHGSTRNASHAY